jgi:hypothetical protein
VSYQNDGRASFALEELKPCECVQHGLRVDARVAIVETQGSDTLGGEGLGQIGKDAPSRPGIPTTCPPDPEYGLFPTVRTSVQNSVDGAISRVQHNTLTCISLVGRTGVHLVNIWNRGVPELTVFVHRSSNLCEEVVERRVTAAYFFSIIDHDI